MNYANMIGYSDIEPYEVVRVINEKTLEIRMMHAELDPEWKPEFVPGGFSAICVNHESQKWIISPAVDCQTIRIRRHKDGRWYSNGNRFALSDKPRKRHDYNF